MKSFAVKSKYYTNVLDIVKPISIALIAMILMIVTGFHVVTVKGASMDTTLESGEAIVVTNFLYTPQCGDIVVINQESTLNKNIIKRVIAVEGQTLKLDYDNDKIFVDGKELNEPYLKCTTFEGKRGDYEVPYVIPSGKLFVLGDNRGISLDSRSSSVGLIDAEDILGKAHFAVFPFNRIGGFSN